MDFASVRAWLEPLSEVALAIAALYVASVALLGVRAEYRSHRAPTPELRATYTEDAKTHYAMATLQKPWVLALILAGALVKLIIALCELFRFGPPPY